MKINRLFSILALLLLCLGFASCGETEKTPTGEDGQEILEKNLIGTWEDYWEQGWEKDSADPSIDASWDNEIPDEDKATVTFNADHTIANESITWRLEGNTLYLIYDPYDPEDSEELTIKKLTVKELVFEEIYKEGTVDFYLLLTYRKK